MVVFGIMGRAEIGKKIVQGLRLFSHLANVGIPDPWCFTRKHIPFELTEEQRRAGGVTRTLRLSVGIGISMISWRIWNRRGRAF
jgi:O-acetylhomoserine (thiol)-lyase